ncbi:unnamed protein product, partial [Laminaria digitata]
MFFVLARWLRVAGTSITHTYTPAVLSLFQLATPLGLKVKHNPEGELCTTRIGRYRYAPQAQDTIYVPRKARRPHLVDELPRYLVREKRHRILQQQQLPRY